MSYKIKGDVEVKRNLHVSGNLTVDGTSPGGSGNTIWDSDVADLAFTTGSIEVTGSALVKSNLSVDPNGRAVSALGVDVFAFISGAYQGRNGTTDTITLVGGDLHSSGNLSQYGTTFTMALANGANFTGLGTPATGQLGLVAAGSNRVSVASSGMFPQTTNTYVLGTPGLAWRQVAVQYVSAALDIRAGRNVNVVGDVEVTGSVVTKNMLSIGSGSGLPAIPTSEFASTLQVIGVPYEGVVAASSSAGTGWIPLVHSTNSPLDSAPNYISIGDNAAPAGYTNPNGVLLLANDGTNTVAGIYSATSGVLYASGDGFSFKDSPGGFATQEGTDAFFFVSGATDSKGSSTRGTAVFGGDVHVSGNLTVDGSSPSGGSGGGGSIIVSGSDWTTVYEVEFGALANQDILADGVLDITGTIGAARWHRNNLVSAGTYASISSGIGVVFSHNTTATDWFGNTRSGMILALPLSGVLPSNVDFDNYEIRITTNVSSALWGANFETVSNGIEISSSLASNKTYVAIKRQYATNRKFEWSRVSDGTNTNTTSTWVHGEDISQVTLEDPNVVRTKIAQSGSNYDNLGQEELRNISLWSDGATAAAPKIPKRPSDYNYVFHVHTNNANGDLIGYLKYFRLETRPKGGVTIVPTAAAAPGNQLQLGINDYATTNTTASTTVGQISFDGSEYSGSVYFTSLLAATSASVSSSVRIFNLDDLAYVEIGGAGETHLGAASTTPVKVTSVDLKGAANFNALSSSNYELQVSSSNEGTIVSVGAAVFTVTGVVQIAAERMVLGSYTTSTATSSNPQAVGGGYVIPSEHVTSSVYFRSILSTSTGSNAALAQLYNVTSGALVHIGGTNITEISTSNTAPTNVSSVDLTTATNFDLTTSSVYEVRVYGSGSSPTTIVHNSELVFF